MRVLNSPFVPAQVARAAAQSSEILEWSPAERLFPAGIYVERRGELVWGFSDGVDPELPRVSYLNQESRMLTVGQICHLTEFQA